MEMTLDGAVVKLGDFGIAKAQGIARARRARSPRQDAR